MHKFYVRYIQGRGKEQRIKDEREMENTCKTCKWRSKDEYGEKICINDSSDYMADYVDDKHSCFDYEPKRKRNLVSQ